MTPLMIALAFTTELVLAGEAPVTFTKAPTAKTAGANTVPPPPPKTGPGSVLVLDFCKEQIIEITARVLGVDFRTFLWK